MDEFDIDDHMKCLDFMKKSIAREFYIEICNKIFNFMEEINVRMIYTCSLLKYKYDDEIIKVYENFSDIFSKCIRIELKGFLEERRNMDIE